METVSENRCFEGRQGVYRHHSQSCGCDMTLGLFLPDIADDMPVPLIWYLSGLTCTHENAMTKAAAQGWAAEAGVAIAFPDTSPRGDDVADDPAYDLGQGAGFYLDATRAPWAGAYSMRQYVSQELPELLAQNFPLDMDRQSVMGHSMGGHGALTLALTNPGRYRAVSAFAPICHPTASEWGRKQFSAYLGDDENAWRAYDATELIRKTPLGLPVLIDVGTEDPFFDHLGIPAFAEAATAQREDVLLRLQKGYDHSYFFVSSFMEDHVDFHASALWA